MGRRRCTEFGTTGLDEALQGLTSSPLPVRGLNSWLGLRIPSFVGSTRFLFCLASFTTRGGRVRGLRQALTIGLDTNSGTTVQRPVELWVDTPDFRFQDGNVSWHLVREPAQRLVTSVPATDTQNWGYLQSKGSALLYRSFTNSNVVPGTAVAGIGNGRPVLYDQGLTAYVPPDVSTGWQSVGGLGTFFDIRFPWRSEHAWSSCDIPIDGGTYSFYASVLQTNPVTRVNAAYPAAATSGTGNLNLDFGCGIPEEAFIANFVQGEDNVSPVQFWRIMGSVIVEDEEG